MLRATLRRPSTKLASYAKTVHAWMEFAPATGVTAPTTANRPPLTGRVEFELYGKTCPMAVENFARLCGGDMVLPEVPPQDGLDDVTFKDQLLPQLTYRGSRVHRAWKDFCVQGGDVAGTDGTGDSIPVFGDDFDAPEELSAFPFDGPGMLGTAVSAPHLNNSQWFVTLGRKGARHLDGTCICFGRVTKGLDLFQALAAGPVDHAGRPQYPIAVADCGVA